jgi:hypothetical protein
MTIGLIGTIAISALVAVGLVVSMVLAAFAGFNGDSDE